jgi:ribosomal protein L39E
MLDKKEKEDEATKTSQIRLEPVLKEPKEIPTWVVESTISTIKEENKKEPIH